jgi:hypothetical protein
MLIGSKNSTPYLEINYGKSTKYSSIPQLGPLLRPTKAKESRAVNQKTRLKPRKMKRKEVENPPTKSYKK